MVCGRAHAWNEFSSVTWAAPVQRICLVCSRILSPDTLPQDLVKSWSSEIVFPPDDLGSGLCTQFIIYTPYIIAAIKVINKKSSFLETYIPKVGVAMLVCWMIWYCYYFLFGFKCTFQLYSSVFFISWYGYKYHVTLCIGQLHPITFYRNGFGVCIDLVLSVTRCSFYYFLDRILFHHDFHHDSCDYY